MQIVCQVLEKMSVDDDVKLENHPLLLTEALHRARNLVKQLKMN